MKKIFSLVVPCILFLVPCLFSQNVGIGTTTPNKKAILDIQSTTKGVLFPRLTTAQRNAITNPPDGLHIFNTNERCLNYFDATNHIWNCYCNNCQVIIIDITSNVCKLDFYNTYAKQSPSKKYIINIAAGVTISGCNAGDTALIFNSMPFDASITISNNGTIAGAGGNGGNGAKEGGCIGLGTFATPGLPGGYAISTKTGVVITINNSGIVAGGGGGGGGSGANPGGFGGGGGGGAGITGGNGGIGGGIHSKSPPFNICAFNKQGQNGGAGQSTLGGAGGAGASGGAAGSNGGGRGIVGQNGIGNLANLGGAAGKAIGGGSGNVLNNLGVGQSFGVVD